jgi:hypothetical protein
VVKPETADMTPFELSLESDLNTEWRRFANEWLFKWHGLNYEGGRVDVDRFDGGRIQYAGIRFGDQQQQIFWQAISAYLNQKIHEMFKRWDAETRSYPDSIRRPSIERVERNLRQFVSQIIGHSVETDRRLRGSGFPESVQLFDASRFLGQANAEIVQLGQAHRLLIDESLKKLEAKTRVAKIAKWIEDFYANQKGLIWLVGVLGSVFIAVFRFFFG